MRKSSNVRSAIVAPDFTNVKLYNDGYKVTISLHISEAVFAWLEPNYYGRAICYRGKHYLHWEKNYPYSISFADAFADAQHILQHMMVLIRETKIEILKAEIDQIEYNAPEIL